MSRNRFGSRRFVRRDLRTASGASSSVCTVSEGSNGISHIKKSCTYIPRQHELRLEFGSGWAALYDSISYEENLKVEEQWRTASSEMDWEASSEPAVCDKDSSPPPIRLLLR